ncbi:MAG: CARDB domain-containing protein [Thermoanaerobaculia bacterium]
MLAATLLLLADLEIASVTPVKDVVTTDETFRVAVRVHNRGPEAAKDVKVTLGVNALTFMKNVDAPEGWTCEQGPIFGYTLACTAPSLAPEAEAEFTMTLASPQHLAMTYRVGGRVEASSQDGDEGNDVRQKGIPIDATEANAELSLTAAAEASRVKVEVRNAGPHDAREVMVVLSEAGHLPLKASGRGWKCDGPLCTRPALKAGTTATLTVATAAPPPGGKAVVSARVRAEQNRESAKDNGATVTLP